MVLGRFYLRLALTLVSGARILASSSSKMTFPRLHRTVRTSLLALLPFSLFSIALAQGAKTTSSQAPTPDADADHEEQRAEWFLHGRVVPGKSTAELRYRAYQSKMQARSVRRARAQVAHPDTSPAATTGGWTPLGPVPLASDATGDGFQDYRQVSGRATALKIGRVAGASRGAIGAIGNRQQFQVEGSLLHATAIGIATVDDAAIADLRPGSPAILALPNAGAINLYKCSINSSNPTCSNPPFMNLTHAYGCDPLGAPAHVHPDQHALAFSILNAGSSSTSDLMYFANDGGIYRALNGFAGLLTGSCSGTNQFDDLNQNLGSMTQFVAFSQDATNANLMFGGAQDNGSPATAAATTSTSWVNILSGDGGYNAIDPNTGDWFDSNPDTGGGTLGIQQCSSGAGCNDSLFSMVVDSGDVGGNDGPFYFPYILDPQSTSSMLVGTCRVWSGPRSGGTFTLLSLNFDTLGIGTCAGTEVNTIRSLAAGGPVNARGSQVIYATTDGPGPNNLSAPIGGNIWVTTDAAPISGVASTFANVTLNGPAGNNINPNRFPISSVAIDTSDLTGDTAYVTVMGFTGGPGHVWQTTNAGV